MNERTISATCTKPLDSGKIGGGTAKSVTLFSFNTFENFEPFTVCMTMCSNLDHERIESHAEIEQRPSITIVDQDPGKLGEGLSFVDV